MAESGVLVKEYRSQEEYQTDAAKLSAEGWRVVSVTEATQRSGCLRMIFLGLFALIWKPKPRLIVTYQK